MSRTPRVIAVVVTWNRRGLLAESLTAVLAQQRPPDEVVVVDNASTDGTSELVRREFGHTDLLTLSRNVGGAGGFAAGVDRALHRHRADLLWLLDDDTIPEPGALGALLTAREAYDDGEPPTLLASSVLWTDGRTHPMNTARRKPGVSRAELAAAAEVGAIPIRSASFVSVLVDGPSVQASGLPLADYFLWNDDFEFSTRLLRDRVGLAVSASRVLHKTATFGSTDADPGARFYFEVRNKLWLYLRSGGLKPWERITYAGSTLVRWVRTYARSSDRRTLRHAFVRGVRAGLSDGPRETGAVLAQAGYEVSDG